MSDSLWPHGLWGPQAPLSMGFSRQEFWSGLPFPLPRDLPDPGIEPTSPTLAGRFFYHLATWEATNQICSMLKLRPYGCSSPCPWTLGRWRQPYCSTIMWVWVFIITPVDVTKLPAATLGFWKVTKASLKSQRTCPKACECSHLDGAFSSVDSSWAVCLAPELSLNIHSI